MTAVPFRDQRCEQTRLTRSWRDLHFSQSPTVVRQETHSSCTRSKMAEMPTLDSPPTDQSAPADGLPPPDSLLAPSACAPPEPTRLAELFRKREAAGACQLLQELSAREVSTEMEAAFRAVEWAPTMFLLAMAQWPPTASRTAFFSLIANGCECMKVRGELDPPSLSPIPSDLAGSLLVGGFEDARTLTSAAFISAFHVHEGHVFEYCMRLLHTRVKTVVTLLDKLRMKHVVPCEVIIAAAVAQNDLEAADCFVRDNNVHQRLFLESLIKRNPKDKAIKKRLVKFGIDERDLPVYYAAKVRSSLRFLVHNRQFEDALVAVRGNPELCVYLCRFVLEKYGSNDPITKLFVHHTGLTENTEFAEVDTFGVEMICFPNKDELEPEPSCLSLEDLGGKDCCIFVDTPESLAACVGDLKRETIVGFDCEWKATVSNLQQAEVCAILQIASSSRAYVIDAIALKGQCSSLREVFQSECIMKLGFDVKGDISVLGKVLTHDGNPRHRTFVQNLVDVQALAKFLNRYKRQRLSTRGGSGEAHDDEVDEAHRTKDHEVPTDEFGTAHAESGGMASKDRQTVENGAHAGGNPPVSGKKKKKSVKKGGNQEGAEEEAPSGSSLSLAAVANEYLAKPLDKRSRMSDWERRPLTTAQLHYAALDAMALVSIFEVMRQRFSDQVFARALVDISRPRMGKRKSSARPQTSPTRHSTNRE